VNQHTSFAQLLLRQIVGAHRALLEAEADGSSGRERAILAARQRLSRLVLQAAVQFPGAREAEDPASAVGP
jgi:hypothetical protein